MTRLFATIRAWGSALVKSGLWVVLAAVAGVIFVMWIAGSGLVPAGMPPKAAKPAYAHPAPVPPIRGACQGRGCPVSAPPPIEVSDSEPQGVCLEDGPPPWGAPVWRECGIRCMYERLRNGFCGPGCDYYYFRMQEYKPRRFYPRKPCYRNN